MSIADEPVLAKPPEESDLVKNLRRLMAERGLNARGLLRKAGIPRSTVIRSFFRQDAHA